MSRGKRDFSAGVAVLALAIAFAWVGGASALTTSNSVAATDERAPEAPTDLVVDVDLGTPAVLLSWTASPSDAVRQAPVGLDFTSSGTFVNVNDVAAYNIRRSDGGDYELVAEVEGTAFDDNTVVAGVTYTYQVTAADAAGNESVPPLVSDPVSLGPPPKGGKPDVPPGSIISRQARLRLGGTIDVGDQTAVDDFLADLRLTLAALLGVSPGRITFTSVGQGSIIVDFVIEEDATGTEPTPDAALADLEAQVASNSDIIAETAAAEGVATAFEPVQSLSSSNVVDVAFGVLGIDDTASETFTFSNTATDPDANLAVNASVSGAGFAVSPASLTIVPGESGSLDVTFSAADVLNVSGEYSGTVTVRTNDPNDRETIVQLAAIVVGLDQPVLDLSGVALSFGQVVTGTTRTRVLTVTNKGDLDLEAILALVDADGVFSIDADTLVLAGGEAAEVSVVFSPVTTGAFTASIDFTSNDPDKPTASVALSGTGAAVITGPKYAKNAQGIVITGFLDDDDDVDFDDFFAFADAFGTVPGDPAYNPQADFEANDAIDFDDFFVFADNFGEVAVEWL